MRDWQSAFALGMWAGVVITVFLTWLYGPVFPSYGG